MYSPVMPSWEASVVELSPSICKISTAQTPEGTGEHLSGLKSTQANLPQTNIGKQSGKNDKR